MTFLCTRNGQLVDGGGQSLGWPQPWAYRCNDCAALLPYGCCLGLNERREAMDQVRSLGGDRHRCAVCDGFQGPTTAPRAKAGPTSRSGVTPVVAPRYRLDLADAARLPWPSNKVHLICTSPPYNLGLRYAGVDDELPYGEYLRRVHGWAEEMYRVATDQGRACVNVPLDTHNGAHHPVYADWIGAMQAAGWTYRTTTWLTKGGRGQTSNHRARGSLDSCSAPNVICGAETIAVFHKGPWSWAMRADRHGRRSDLTRAEWVKWTDGSWDFPFIRRSLRHPAPFPEELPRRLIKLYSYPADIVADPFVGSGTTLLQALELGRDCWAADLSAQYVDDLQEQLTEREARAA